METVDLPIDSLTPDPDNARIHSQRNLDAIKASLERFGQQKPIVVDRHNVVRAGNGTMQAARDLGWESIACVYSDLADAEMWAFAVADNRTGELAEWDTTQLARVISDIQSAGEDPSVLGFSDNELRAFRELSFADSQTVRAELASQGSVDHVPGTTAPSVAPVVADSDEEAGEAPPPIVESLFPLLLRMTSEQNAIVREAHEVWKEGNPSDSLVEAIVGICARYCYELEEESEDGR